LAKPAFYTNESVHIAVAEGIKRRGLKALTARDAGNLGLSDKEHLELLKVFNFLKSLLFYARTYHCLL